MKMQKISGFQFYYKNENMYTYDFKNNPDGLNMRDLSANGFRWNVDGVDKIYLFRDSGLAFEIPNLGLFAVVDQDEKWNDGQAYFLNALGEFVRNVELPDVQKNYNINFYDGYMTPDGIEFLFHSSDGEWYDYAVVIDPKTLKLKDFHPSR
jgi:hypothetical protein